MLVKADNVWIEVEPVISIIGLIIDVPEGTEMYKLCGLLERATVHGHRVLMVQPHTPGKYDIVQIPHPGHFDYSRCEKDPMYCKSQTERYEGTPYKRYFNFTMILEGEFDMVEHIDELDFQLEHALITIVHVIGRPIHNEKMGRFPLRQWGDYR